MTQRPPRIVIMPGNDAVSDARVLKNLATAVAFGFDAWALGVRRSGTDETLAVGDAQVRIVKVAPRLALVGARPWGTRMRALLGARYADERTARAARAYAAHLRQDPYPGFAKRDAGRAALVARADALPQRAKLTTRLHAAAAKTAIGLRSRLGIPADSEPAAHDEGSRAKRIASLTKGPGRVRWRSAYRIALDDEHTFGPILEQLDPDVIHVHDVFMMGVAAKAAAAAAARGRDVKLVYDAREYLPGLAHIDPRLVAGYVDLEREYLRHFDAVITVSEELADWLVRDHQLVERPTLVYNAPAVAAASKADTIRDTLGLDADAPIAVYAGGVNPARGVHTAVDALPHVPQLHLALVANVRSATVLELESRAAQLGVADRFHVVPFVDAEQVVEYLSTATIGLSTLLRAPNHDVALTNKFCEYIQAGLVIVTSDTPTQQRIVNAERIGAVYRAGDAEDLARALTEVLGDLDAIRARLADPGLRERFSWAAQAANLRELYAGLLGELPPQAWEPGATQITTITPERTRKR